MAGILGLIKHAGVKEAEPIIFRKWYKLYLPLKAEIEKDEEGGPASGRQLKGAVTWPTVLAARARLAKEAYGSKEHLLLAMYTYLAPRRQEDYHQVLLITARPYPRKMVEMPAYLDLTVSPMVLKVNDYKTAKKYEAWTKELTDPELTAIIKSSLSQEPRQHLFAQKNGEAFKTANAFTQFSNRVLKKHVGPNVTLNSLRHAAAKASLTDERKSKAQMDAYALDMAHSVMMHRKYNKVIPEVNPEVLPEEEVKSGVMVMNKAGEAYDCKCVARSSK